MLKKAFSLVELMVTLIVVSCLIAAMAPVITKKMKNNSVVISGGNSSSGGSGGSTGGCDVVCASNQAKDSSACTCSDCSELFGEFCLKCDMTKCAECTGINYLNSGQCIECPDGYYCDGTNKIICPKGFYCIDGEKNPCASGYYNDSTGASASTDCKLCSTLTSNCATCDRATGLCEACDDGYDLTSDGCKSKDFIYTYTGSHTRTTMDGYTRVVLTSSGTFISNSTTNATIFLIGGGGGGGAAAWGGWAGSEGCKGYSTQTEFTLLENKEWSVTVGDGGKGGSGSCASGNGGNGKSGGSTSFDTISASGGGGGIGSGNSGSCAGGNKVTFAEMTFANSKGENTGYGGSAGDGNWYSHWDEVSIYCGNDGGKGYSGIVVITVDI